MASTINASTSAGLVSTADTSGVLQLQTAGTTAVTVDASQNVGIGTASPVNKLVVSNAGAAGFEVNPSDASGVALASYNRSGAAYANSIYYASNQIFCTGGTTEGMRLTSTGLGIGTSSPTAKLHVVGSSVIFQKAGPSQGQVQFGTTDTTHFIQAGNDYFGMNISSVGTGNTGINFITGTSGAGSTTMTLDASGNLLVGVATNGGTNAKFEVDYAGYYGPAYVNTDNFSGTQFQCFYNSTFGLCGSIARVTTTNAVTYNTTSDYRLKTVIGPVANSGSRIDALQPVEYEWKADGSRTRGFLAHEFQEIYANSVSGAKDAVDADGNPKYQAMQAATSEVIADLVAEIQSLRIRIAQLEAK